MPKTAKIPLKENKVEKVAVSVIATNLDYNFGAIDQCKKNMTQK